MSINSIDVTAIGNAIVDVLAQCDDKFLNENNITKSSMNLIDEERSKFLFDNYSAVVTRIKIISKLDIVARP